MEDQFPDIPHPTDPTRTAKTDLKEMLQGVEKKIEKRGDNTFYTNEMKRIIRTLNNEY
jgi:hypothetical protein